MTDIYINKTTQNIITQGIDNIKLAYKAMTEANKTIDYLSRIVRKQDIQIALYREGTYATIDEEYYKSGTFQKSPCGKYEARVVLELDDDDFDCPNGAVIQWEAKQSQ